MATMPLRLSEHMVSRCSPCDLEYPKESHTTEHRDAQGGHDGQLHQDGLHDASTHHETVEAVKQRHEVGLQPQTVHLHQHLQGEHCQENFVGYVCREENLVQNVKRRV